MEEKPHRFDGVEFRVNGHEIGHLHGGRWVDLPFPVRVRKELFRLNYERLTARKRGSSGPDARTVGSDAR